MSASPTTSTLGSQSGGRKTSRFVTGPVPAGVDDDTAWAAPGAEAPRTLLSAGCRAIAPNDSASALAEASDSPDPRSRGDRDPEQRPELQAEVVLEVGHVEETVHDDRHEGEEHPEIDRPPPGRVGRSPAPPREGGGDAHDRAEREQPEQPRLGP